MPRKIRELIRDLHDAGFERTSQKGSHRKFEHPHGASVIVSGSTGEDAQRYQEKEVRDAIQEALS